MLKTLTYTLHLDSFRRRSGSWIFPDPAVRSAEIGSSVLAAQGNCMNVKRVRGAERGRDRRLRR
jgi:hypothetical protein